MSVAPEEINRLERERDRMMYSIHNGLQYFAINLETAKFFFDIIDRKQAEIERLTAVIAERGEEIANKAAEISDLKDGLIEARGGSYPTPEGGWQCFHCGEWFKSEASARSHFGKGPHDFSALAQRYEKAMEAVRKSEMVLKAIANIHESDGVGANPLLFCIETSEQALASLRAAIQQADEPGGEG